MKTCPNCHKPLASNAPDGLCPECLVKAGLPTGVDITDPADPHGTKVTKPPPTPDEIRAFFPQFDILECLGRGGMGVVYKARQKSLDRIVALKILAPEKEKDPQFAERFGREARTLAKLNHSNIVTVHDFGEAGGMFYLVMEFVDGVNLRHLLRERKLSPEEALAIVPKVCEALQFAHEQGIVHRDIKPENLLLDRQGRIKIADFGIAKILGRREPGAGETREVIGTPQYMAPEQVQQPQRVDHRADIYSLGVVLYEMLTGEVPGAKIQPPSKKVQLDVRIDEIVMRALEQEPELRYQTAADFRTQVETIATTPALPSVVSPQRTRINWVPALVFSVLLTALEVMMLEADVKYPGLSDAFLPLIVVLAVAVVSAVLWGLLHYRCWKALPERFRATTPGKAVGRLFIPLYNFYWGFISFPKLADGFNAIRAEHPHLPLVNMGKLGLAYAVLMICEWTLWWVPFLGSCVSLASLIVFIFFYRGIVHNANLVISQSPLLDGSPEATRTNETVLARARKAIKAPATALFIVGCLNFGVVLALLAYNLFLAGHDGSPPASFAMLPVLFLLAGYGVTVIGASRMRLLTSYGWAMAATLCAMFLPIGCFIGFPVGIWSLIVLNRREVREAFGKARVLSAGTAQPERGGASSIGTPATRLFEGTAQSRVAPSGLKRLAIAVTVIMALLLSIPGYKLLTDYVRFHNPRVVASPAPTFGPVIERIIGEARLGNYLDLDRGEYCVMPSDLASSSDADRKTKWLREHGADLGGNIGGASTGVAGCDMAWVAVGSSVWEDTTPADLWALVAARHADSGFGTETTSTNWTMAFRTREGGFGLLQTQGLSDNPRGVKLRYKLVQNGTANASALRSPFPKPAHISKNNRSVLLHGDDVDLHYALFYAGNFGSSVADSNLGGNSWLDNGGITLVNGRTFGYRRESSDPERLHVNGKEYDLRAGRVLVLRNDGRVEQKYLFPALDTARSPEALAQLIHHQDQEVDAVTATGMQAAEAAAAYAVQSYAQRETESKRTTNVAAVGGAMTFGPVIKRVVNDISAGSNSFLNLETGELLSTDAKLTRWEDMLAWSKQHDADVVADEDGHSGGQRGLTLFDGIASFRRELTLSHGQASVTRDDAVNGSKYWVESTAESVIQDAREMDTALPKHPDRLPISKMRADGKATPTYIFKTRHGRVGILQITGFLDNPRGVKIRYKLVQSGEHRTNLKQSPFGPTATPAKRLATGEFSQDFQMTVPLAAKGRFSLDNPNGSVEITGWEGNTVLINGVKRGRNREAVEATRIDVDSRADQVGVRTILPRKGSGWGGASINLDANTRGNSNMVVVAGGTASITVNSSVPVTVVSGGNDNVSVDYKIQVPRTARLEKIENANGSVVIEGVTGDITASAANGSVRAKGSAANLKLSAANGGITAEPASLSGGQSVLLDAGNGSITVTLPAQANATVTADTTNGGITSEFPALKVKKDFPTGNHLNGTLGTGSASVKARTANGSITIRRGK